VLFAVHPVHTEAVSWISGRPYLLLAFFTLLVYILYYKKTLKFYLASLLIFSYFIINSFSFYALLPLFIILTDVIFGKWRRNWRFWVPFILITTLRLAVASQAIQQRIAMATAVTGRVDASRNLFFYFVYSLCSHLWLLIWPARLTLYHEPVIFYPWAMWLGFIALCALACFLPYLFKKAKVILLGIGIFVLFLVPTYAPFPVANVVTERYVYLPSILLSILIAFLYENYAFQVNAARKKIFIAFFVILTAVYTSRTIARNEEWKDEDTFWLATLKASPDSSGAHNNAGFVYLKEKNIDRAIEEFNTAIKINPAKPDSYNNLGVAYKSMGKTDEAVAFYKKAIAISPDYAQAYNNLANIYNNAGKLDEAVALYHKAIELSPDYVEALNNLGVVYKNMGKFDRAIALYNKAIELNPDYSASYKNLAVIYYLKGQYDLAMKYYCRAVALGYKADSNFLKLIRVFQKKEKDK